MLSLGVGLYLGWIAFKWWGIVVVIFLSFIDYAIHMGRESSIMSYINNFNNSLYDMQKDITDIKYNRGTK